MNRLAGETACPTPAKWFGCHVGQAVLPAFRGVRPILSHLLTVAAPPQIRSRSRQRAVWNLAQALMALCIATDPGGILTIGGKESIGRIGVSED